MTAPAPLSTRARDAGAFRRGRCARRCGRPGRRGGGKKRPGSRTRGAARGRPGGAGSGPRTRVRRHRVGPRHHRRRRRRWRACPFARGASLAGSGKVGGDLGCEPRRVPAGRRAHQWDAPARVGRHAPLSRALLAFRDARRRRAVAARPQRRRAHHLVPRTRCHPRQGFPARRHRPARSPSARPQKRP